MTRVPTTASALQSRLEQALLGAANRAGGWPYYAGKASRIEATCWALLALAESSAAGAAEWARAAGPHLQWLATTQRRDGLLVDQADAPPNFTANGLAAFVLSLWAGRPALAGPSARPDLPRLIAALVAAKGVAVDDASERQDNRLQGWPWIADTFSWLEPTAWCVLALEKGGAAAAGAAPRVQEAEKLMLNRPCEPGGWNVGNAAVSGQDLRPYVPTTALALIALQNRREAAEVRRSVSWLRDARLKEPSAIALSLTAIALRLYGLASDDVEARLAADLDRAE